MRELKNGNRLCECVRCLSEDKVKKRLEELMKDVSEKVEALDLSIPLPEGVDSAECPATNAVDELYYFLMERGMVIEERSRCSQKLLTEVDTDLRSRGVAGYT